MSWDKTDYTTKKVVNKRSTDNAKRISEERGDFTLNIHSSEIWMDSIPWPPPSVTSSIVHVYTTLSLVKDTSVPNAQAWFATSNPSNPADETSRLKDWISDKYDQDNTATYAVKIFDNNGVEVRFNDTSNWIFDYQTGILVFANSSLSVGSNTYDVSVQPFTITGWRYVGRKGVPSGSVQAVGGINGIKTDQALNAAITNTGNLQLDLAYSPTWTGTHTFSLRVIGSGGFAGSVASGGNLNITSTTHSMKGSITLAPITVDEFNQFVGFANAIPSHLIDAVAALSSSSASGMGASVFSNLAPPADTTFDNFGVSSILLVTSSSTHNFSAQTIASQGKMSHQGSGSIALGIGSKGLVTINSAGSITDARGVSGSVAQTSGTITAASSLYAESITGTVGTAYGVHIAAQTAGTTNYSIYAAGGEAVINTGGTGTIALTLRGASGQSVNLFETRADGNVLLVAIHQNGHLLLNPYGSSTGQTAELRLYPLSGGNYVAFKSADSRSSAITYVLPSTAPLAGQVLSAAAPTSGLSALSWVDANAGTVSGSGTVNTLPVFTSTTGIGDSIVSQIPNGNNGTETVLFVDGVIRAKSKSFDIPHPTQPNKRLIYGSLEGPENGAYYRGRAKGYGKVRIELPEYWEAFIGSDYDVTITAYGDYSLYVKSRDEKGFTVDRCSSTSPRRTLIEFSFMAIGSRIDAPLEVEPFCHKL